MEIHGRNGKIITSSPGPITTSASYFMASIMAKESQALAMWISKNQRNAYSNVWSSSRSIIRRVRLAYL